MSERVFLSPPDIGQLEEDTVLEALRSGWVAPLGPHVDAFEDALAEMSGRSHAIALSSGTAALHLGLLQLQAAPDSVVIVPTMTFAATAFAVTYTGAQPVFVDCDAHTGNLDVGLLRAALADLRATGRHIAAVVPVDLFGRCADYPGILAACEEFEVPVLADAAESLGSRCQDGSPSGSFGAAAIFSFNGNKIATTSGGGALVTDNRRMAAHTRYLSTQAREPVTHYEHNHVGFNYRLSNILAAIGSAQLQRLPEMIRRRRYVRETYREVFASAPEVTLFQSEQDDHDNCWLTAIVVDSDLAGWRPSDLAATLAAANIESRPLWKPMHLQPVFADSRAFITGNAERLFDRGLALPSGSAMRDDQLGRVRDHITRFLDAR